MCSARLLVYMYMYTKLCAACLIHRYAEMFIILSILFYFIIIPMYMQLHVKLSLCAAHMHMGILVTVLLCV